MKKVLYVLLPQFAEHEMPYLTQPLRSDSFAMIQETKHRVRHPSVHDGTETILGVLSSAILCGISPTSPWDCRTFLCIG